MQQPEKDTEEYYKYWENRGYEFVEGRTIDAKTGFTKYIWVKRKIIQKKGDGNPAVIQF